MAYIYMEQTTSVQLDGEIWILFLVVVSSFIYVTLLFGDSGERNWGNEYLGEYSWHVVHQIWLCPQVQGMCAMSCKGMEDSLFLPHAFSGSIQGVF